MNLEETQWRDLLTRSYRQIRMNTISVAITPTIWVLVVEMLLHTKQDFGMVPSFPAAYSALILMGVFALSFLATHYVERFPMKPAPVSNPDRVLPHPFPNMIQIILTKMVIGVIPGMAGLFLAIFTGNRLFVWVGVPLCWTIMALNFPRTERWQETAERMRTGLGL